MAVNRAKTQERIRQALFALSSIESPQEAAPQGRQIDANRYPRVTTQGSSAQGQPGSTREAVFNTALQKLIARTGGKIKITSGKRTRAQQADLYRRKPHLAAKPGTSKHERGEAADLAYADDATRELAHAVAKEYGLSFPMLTKAPGKKFEPWHIELR